MNSRCELKLDWCSHEAAKYAAQQWHYSRTLSSGRNVYIGVWEDGVFCGAIVFGVGSGNVTNGTRYGLARSHQMAELTRIALGPHRHPVSRIVAIALKMLKRHSPGIRLVISMADPVQGHHGGVYQAGGWIYTGRTAPDYECFLRGRWMHHRSATSLVGSVKGLPKRPIPGKHRYLMPLDGEIRQRIEPMRKPYPKRAGSADSGTPADQAGGGGANPTSAL